MVESLLNNEWLTKLILSRRLYVGFSGGLDSTVLLHSLWMQPDLRNKLYAIHIHHGLSDKADAWQNHCQNFCEAHDIPFIARTVQFERKINIEENARTARYEVFSSFIRESDYLLLGHHRDDQAETLLLQLLRGSGVDGLAGIASEKPFLLGTIGRPFLHLSRRELEVYARKQNLRWVEDDSNQDSAFVRNYLRHQVLPILQAKWPGAVNNMARSARHLQEARMNLEELALLDCPELAKTGNTLPLASLKMLKRVRLKNILRVWIKKNQVRLPSAVILERIINEVILAEIDKNPIVPWENSVIRRYQNTLYLLKKEQELSSLDKKEWYDFPSSLLLGKHGILNAVAVEKGFQMPESSRMEVHVRQGGELFYWRGQTKQLKKLWQQWQVPTWLREKIPLVFVDGQLAVVVGYAISDHFYGSGKAYHIEWQQV